MFQELIKTRGRVGDRWIEREANTRGEFKKWENWWGQNERWLIKVFDVVRIQLRRDH